jgi:16S rRNA processing protein RimM
LTSDLLHAGRVGRPHGLDGSFHVTRPVEGLLAADGVVLVAGAERRIERLAGTQARPIVRLSDCSSREEAEALRGEPLLSQAEVPLEEGEFLAKDLEGCFVVDGAREIGVVSRMIALPSCEALEVGSLLIPMVRDAIRSIDVEARRIDVDMEFLGA